MITPSAILLTVVGVSRPREAWPELRLSLTALPARAGAGMVTALRLENRGTTAVAVDAVTLVFAAGALFGAPAACYRFYKEGLTAVGVAGARAATDCDFELDPGFLRLTVSAPAAYRWDRPGRLCAEQVGVLARQDTGAALLAGFVTALRYCCRVELLADGPAVALHAVVDTEGLPLPPGESWDLEALLVTPGADVERLLADFAAELGARMAARLPAQAPAGWCSYYFYYGQETEQAILENARFLAAQPDLLPGACVQIDDGWQQARGNWLVSHPAKFPHGMAWLAREITALGLQPGLWVAPLLVSPDTPLRRAHPDWLLHDHSGELLTMGSDAFLDPTHPAALAWLAEAFTTMRGWGYAYFKLDFLFVATCQGARYHDTAQPRLAAYRRVLQVIRDAVGPTAYLLGGTSLMAANVGLVDGCRIATDVTPFWARADCTPESPAIVNVCRNLINRGYLHRRLWGNDPDCLIVREQHGREKYRHIPSLTLAETRLLASAITLSGGALFLGDRLAMLPPERLAIIRQVVALANGRSAVPLDRLEQTVPRLWWRPGAGTAAQPHLLGVFNWAAAPAEITVPLDRLGLDPDRPWQARDVWPDQPPPPAAAPLAFALPPHACRLLTLWQ
jgi:alpha-galactosidase